MLRWKKSQEQETMKAIIVLVVALAFAMAPFLSPEFGGIDPDRYPVPQNNPPVQPVGWAFSIWGPIYLWLVAHAAVGTFKFSQDAEWDKGRIALALSLAVGTIWLPVALVSPIWATILIWIMLIAALIATYRSEQASPAWIAKWPLALYAGWLSVASFLSIGLLLAGYGFVGEFMAAVIALLLAVLFTGYNAVRLKSWPYALAVSWGFFGIVVTNMGSTMPLAVAAVLAAVAIPGLTALTRQSLG
ncbi:tryptophan-rich sensory protein [uncultured Parasphingorhabdus sp.]|uniref:tryptophan-rich sensory protein n=1 Tax=uncultured Parasphingorhabdus sp. TaxID=2709694 RepID=UPI002AA7AD1C|nr:tryptophan-rich sensory protein [uncultured Parasphingorhabdus sp.]